MATVSTSARLRRIQLGIPEPDAADGAAGPDGAPEAAVTSGRPAR